MSDPCHSQGKGKLHPFHGFFHATIASKQNAQVLKLANNLQQLILPTKVECFISVLMEYRNLGLVWVYCQAYWQRTALA
jgi:hypothetical protein